MGVAITGYTEAKIGEKWYCIDFYQYDREDHLHIVPCIEGASSCAGALDEDCDVWRIEVPTELSDLVRKECTASDGTLYGENDQNWKPWHKVEGTWFSEVDLSQPEFCGFFPKQSMADYLLDPESNELDEYEMISVDEYRELDEEAMKAYQYYEYTPKYGHRGILRRFKEAVEKRIDVFNEYLPYRERIGFADVRVILIYS